MAKSIAQRTLVCKIDKRIEGSNESFYTDAQGNEYPYSEILRNSKKFSIIGLADETLDKRGKLKRERLNRRRNGSSSKGTSKSGEVAIRNIFFNDLMGWSNI